MVPFFGDYDTTETVIIPFNTFTSDDPSASATITNLAAGDVEIHKDGGTTQRSSDSGVTVAIDFDSVTGNHIVSIDLSDNSDAGFYAAGSRYQVRVEGTTVDGATVNAWIGVFSIGCVLRPTTDGRTLDVNATGEAGLDLDNTSGTIAASQLAADCITADKIADDAIAAEHIAAGAIVAATFAADVDAEIAAYVWNAATASYGGAGTYGQAVEDVSITAADVADAVWDEVIADHAGVGSTGAALAAAGGSGDPWSTAIPGAYGAGTAGYILGNHTPQTGDTYAQLPSHFGDLSISETTGLVSLTQTFPANFADLGINASGHVSRVTLADTVTTLTNMPSCPTDWLTDAGLSAAAVTKIEAALINEGDGQALIDAIVQAIDAADIENDVLPALIRNEILNRVLSGNHDTPGTVGKLLQDASTLTQAQVTGGAYPLDTDANGRVRLVSGTGAGEINLNAGSVAHAINVSTLDDEAQEDIRTSIGMASANLDTQLGNLQTHGDGAWATATSVTVSDKTGFKLASDGLDTISTTAPTGVAANFREMFVQTWRRFFKKATQTSTELKTYADNGTDVLTTQTLSDDGETQTQGDAS